MSDPRWPAGVDDTTPHTAAQFAALPRRCQVCNGTLTYTRVDQSDASDTTNYYSVGGTSCTGGCTEQEG